MPCTLFQLRVPRRGQRGAPPTHGVPRQVTGQLRKITQPAPATLSHRHRDRVSPTPPPPDPKGGQTSRQSPAVATHNSQVGERATLRRGHQAQVGVGGNGNGGEDDQGLHLCGHVAQREKGGGGGVAAAAGTCGDTRRANPRCPSHLLAKVDVHAQRSHRSGLPVPPARTPSLHPACACACQQIQQCVAPTRRVASAPLPPHPSAPIVPHKRKATKHGWARQTKERKPRGREGRGAGGWGGGGWRDHWDRL
jgi:hypothetical protein